MLDTNMKPRKVDVQESTNPENLKCGTCNRVLKKCNDSLWICPKCMIGHKCGRRL
jgi:ribosomal protein L37AE/L43A